MDDRQQEPEGPVEIALVGDLTENQADLCDKLLGVAPGGRCVLHFDSLGGSPYVAVALATLIRVRDLQATAVVVAECSSAAIWPFAACRRRYVTPYSVFLFHPMKWHSEENVGITEAAEWARHFGQLEGEMDGLLAELFGVSPDLLRPWLNPGRYVSAQELVDAGLAKMIALAPLPELFEKTPAPRRRRK